MPQTVTIQRDGLVATVDSAGAQLASLRLNGAEYLWQRDPRWWNKSAPILFPLVGTPGFESQRSAAGACRLPRHGFARSLEHRVVNHEASSVTFELCDSAQTRDMYPYAFTLRTTFSLTNAGTLRHGFAIENRGDIPMPFALGGHPAFNVPLPGVADGRFEEHELRFTRPWSSTSPKVVDGGLLSCVDPLPVSDDSDTVVLTRDRFAFDTMVLRDVPDHTVTLQGRTGKHGVRLTFPDFDFLGIWSAQPDAPFVALEPWTCQPTRDTDDDVLEHRDGIIILAPHAVEHRSFSIGVW